MFNNTGFCDRFLQAMCKRNRNAGRHHCYHFPSVDDEASHSLPQLRGPQLCCTVSSAETHGLNTTLHLFRDMVDHVLSTFVCICKHVEPCMARKSDSDSAVPRPADANKYGNQFGRCKRKSQRLWAHGCQNQQALARYRKVSLYLVTMTLTFLRFPFFSWQLPRFPAAYSSSLSHLGMDFP